jgi:DNA modification methylase
MNCLYYGDNLDVLRRYIKNETVDLVYLDPPFKSNQDYNVLFAEKDGTAAAAQFKAFEDTWEWNQASAQAYEETVEAGGKVSQVMQSFRGFLGTNDLLAYLTMMAPRLVELRRVLKATGSIWLHCDPTASHYLKLLMDAAFGPERILNEVTWKRSSAHSDTKQGMKRCGRIRDILLVYSKSEQYTWNPMFTPYTPEYLESEYRHIAPDGRRYKETDLTAARPGGDTGYEWRVKKRGGHHERWIADLNEEFEHPKPDHEYLGVRPYKGRFWAYSRQNMVEFARAKKLIHRSTGMPRLMQFADEMPGIPLQDLWDDIPPETGSLDLGYPTQKPEALLERIVRSSSNEGDTVLDPFCGCGTAIAVAERLKRQWIGIDITHLAIGLIKHRLRDAFGDGIAQNYQVIGEPVSLPDAAQLAKEDPFQFQWWALGLVGARRADQTRGRDQGIDGRLYFHDEAMGGSTKLAVLSVKSGHVGVKDVRDLRGVIEREKAAIGVLLTLEEPTKPMLTEAATAGFYKSPWGSHPRLQILTIAELLDGKRIDYPPAQQVNVTFKKAPRSKDKEAETRPLDFPEGSP